MIDKRWVLTALVLLTLLVVAAVTGVIFNAPTLEIAIGRASIITAAAAGPIGVLMLMLQVGNVQQQVGGVQEQVTDVQSKVNGHLDKHVGHTDAEVQQLIDERLRALAAELAIKPGSPPGAEA